MDSHHGKIFSPLSNQDTIISAQELRQIQATLRDLTAKSKSETEKKLYFLGNSLCTLLLNAIAEREKHSRRLADTHSKGYDSPFSKRQDRERDIQRKKEFFEGAIHRSWETTSTRIRTDLDRQYDYMRLLEK